MPPRRADTTTAGPAIQLALRCVCGSTLRGTIKAPLSDVFALRDLFLSLHRKAGCTVVDTSRDVVVEAPAPRKRRSSRR